MDGISYLLGSINVYSGQVQEAVVPAIVGFKMFNWLYLIGVILLLTRLIYGIVRLGDFPEVQFGQKLRDIEWLICPVVFNPFSFFHVIL